jgi:hypothetical protein
MLSTVIFTFLNYLLVQTLFLIKSALFIAKILKIFVNSVGQTICLIF